jgi:sulfoxide reductase heme-binding subunit YedZ
VSGKRTIFSKAISEVNRSDHHLGFRLLRHHLPLAASSALLIVLLYVTRPYKDAFSRLSFATAYPAIVLLATTLLIGPINILMRRRNPVSSDLRRDIGIWAGAVSILHAVVGQCVHLRGRPWLYYVYGPQEKHVGLRHDVFGFANYTGLLATVVVITLFATSNDLSLRALGTPRWKAIQRWNYAVFGLAAMHSFGYQAIEKQKVLWVSTIVSCVVITIAVQLTGFLKRRRSARESLRDFGPGTAEA